MTLYGWLRDLPDPKDFNIAALFKQNANVKAASGNIDLRSYTTPSNQYNIGSCFPSGTLILMEDFTERPIEQVAVGNKVRTHTGKVRSVTNTFTRSYSGLTYRVTVQGYGYPLTMTEEHPVGVIPNVSSRAKYREYEPGELTWVKAKDLKPGDFVIITGKHSVDECKNLNISVADYISEELYTSEGRVRLLTGRRGFDIPQQVEVTETFAQLIGLFLAEGSYEKAHGRPVGVNFTFAWHEEKYQEFVVHALESIFGAAAEIQCYEQRPSVKDVHCSNATLARLFHGLCGDGALSKFVDPVFFASPRRVQLHLLKGWLQGDGTQSPVRLKRSDGKVRGAASIEGTTSSTQLSKDMFRVSLLCGLKPTLQVRPQASHQNAEAKVLSFYSKDILEIFPDAEKIIEDAGVIMTGQTWYRRHDLGFLCRIKSIEVSEAEELPVHNLEVEGEHTYVANNIAVHNCAGNATADSVEILNAIEGKPRVELSRLFVYSMARTLHQALDKDEGTYIRTCFKVLSTFGICEESVWPYNTKKVFVSPSLTAQRRALGHKIHSFYRISSTGQDRIDEVTKALKLMKPVVFGTRVDQAFKELQTFNPVGEPRGKTLGGHAMIIVGVLDGNFIVKNSWGTSWGQKGFWLMKPSYLAWKNTHDLWVPTLGVEFR
jgi:hypothetical protein